MKIMLLGAGGFIGRAVAAACFKRGHLPICVSRKCPERESRIGQWAEGDRNDPDGIARLMEVHACDGLIDMIGYTVDATERLFQTLASFSGRYVLISSSDVYRNYGLLNGTETGAPDPGLLGEDAPKRSGLYPYRQDAPRPDGAADKWMDEYDKILVEATVRERAKTWTICRLPMVYGPGDPQARFAWALGPMKAGMASLEAPPQWLDWLTTFGYVENVAEAIVHTIDHPAAIGEIFNITDDEAPVDLLRWGQRFADVLEWSGRIVRSETPDHPIARATAALDLTVPLKMSGEKLRRLTGVSSPIDLTERLRRTAAAAR